MQKVSINYFSFSFPPNKETENWFIWSRHSKLGVVCIVRYRLPHEN